MENMGNMKELGLILVGKDSRHMVVSTYLLALKLFGRYLSDLEGIMKISQEKKTL